MTRYIDEFGFEAPRDVRDGPRRLPPEGFSTGPEVGSVMPDIVLPGIDRVDVDLHLDRSGRKAAVVFFRSAVW